MAPESALPAAQSLLIRVDSRKRQSPIQALLAAFPDVTLSFAALPSAGYLLSDDVAVERKTASDFVASILDRRLFGQTTRMKVLFPRAMLIIEGDLSQVPHSIDMEAIRGALAFLTVREGITVCSSAIPRRRRRCCGSWRDMPRSAWMSRKPVLRSTKVTSTTTCDSLLQRFISTGRVSQGCPRALVTLKSYYVYEGDQMPLMCHSA